MSSQSSRRTRIGRLLVLPLMCLPLAMPGAVQAKGEPPTGPKARAAHKMRLGPLSNTVNHIAADRVADPTSPWIAHGIERCALVRGSRRHRHLGGCLVHFARSDGSTCSYGIYLRFRSSRSSSVRVRYADLQPDDLSCPSSP